MIGSGVTGPRAGLIRAGQRVGHQRLDQAVDVVPGGLDVGLEPVLAQRRARHRADADQPGPARPAPARRSRKNLTVEDDVKVT